MKHTLLLLALAANIPVFAQVVINEAAHTNVSTIADEDGEYPDWIELYNAGAAAVNLQEYALTDDPDQPAQWLLPDTLLLPGAHLLVFASGKDRGGYDAEIASIDHWETAIYDADIWEYYPAFDEPDPAWQLVGFAGGWDTGMGGFGFGDDDDATEITDDVSAVYYRKEFEVLDKTQLVRAIINMDYDDGYVIYLNGVMVASFGLVEDAAYDALSVFSAEAQLYDGGTPAYIYLDSTTLAGLLVDGTNVLAVQVHNKTAGSNDLTGRTWLSFGITDATVYYGTPPVWFEPNGSTEMHTNFKISNDETIALFFPTGTLADSVTIDSVFAGLSVARMPDGGLWCISDTPTPDTVNAGLCATEYSAPPVITPAAGFYTGDQTVTITGTNVKYTLDGTEPNAFAIDYAGPFVVSASTVVKAKCFEADKLPSGMVTASLFINEPTLLPVVSISATPCDLFDLADSCIAAYDNVNDFNNNNPQAKVTVEYFEADKTFGFSAETKFEAVGNYSISLPQKGVQFTCDEDFNSPENIDYTIYQKDKPLNDSYHAFRLRNTDNDSELTRMRDLIVNRFAMPTHCVAAGSQNVAAFINGEYWGHYVSRERLDQYFCRDNFGCDPESVDMIKTSFTFGGGGNYVTEAGTDTAFFNLHTFCVEHDLTVPEYYQYVIDRVDEQNWADYYATEIYIANDDWMGFIFNNIRLFRATSPEVEWKFILWDLSYSQDGVSGTGPGSNAIADALDDNNFYNDMFLGLLENTEYFNYFVNRFADLMNYYYTPEIIHGVIDENTAEMITEMNAHDDRWNTGDSLDVLEEVQVLKDFHTERPSYQFDDIENYFDLNGQVDVTIDVNPPGAGFVKISTIMPTTLPWTGIYFDGVPVTLTAVANPGYTFVNWTDNPFIDTLDNMQFTADINTATTFVANFNGAPIENPIVISEVNYNCDSTLNTGDWIELHNTSDAEIQLTDYMLSNTIFYNDYQFPTGTSIAPHGYLVVAESIEEFFAIHPDIENVIGGFEFNLENDGDSITLLDYTQQVVAAFRYNDKRPWPVTADNYGRTMELVDATADPALPESWFDGCVGGSPGVAYTPCLENPLVYEINYNSADTADAGDWFEIYNSDISEWDLSGWTVKDKNGNAFVLPAGTLIAADSFLVIYQDDVLFTSRFPETMNKVGPSGFGLSSEDDIISIYDAGGIIYQSVAYDSAAPYPLSANGGGYTLQLSDITLNLNDGDSWMEACPEGSPGTDYYFPCVVPEDTTEDTTTTFTEDLVNGAMLLYPNPASAEITIIFGDAAMDMGDVYVYDMSGRIQVYMPNISNSVIIPVAQLGSGVYLVQKQCADARFMDYFIRE